MKKLIQWGNSKFPNILMFNIPATKAICGRVCTGCYSHKAYKIYPNVLPAQEERYQAALQPDFAIRVKKEIARVRNPFKHFRIHASAGEFFSQPYVNAWHSIALAFPTITFFAYTKRLRDFDFSQLQSLPNVCIIDSFFFGGLNYGKLERKPAGAFLCPDYKGNTGVQCGTTCTYCQTKGGADTNGVYFLQH